MKWRTLPVEQPGPLRKRKRLRTIAVLPTVMTLGNLLFGFAAIYFCLRAAYGVGAGIEPSAVKTLHSEQIERLLPSFLAIAAWCIFAGLIFDALDGRVARISKQMSRFGAELDSIADIVTFGIAPAILIITTLTVVSGGWPATPLTPDPLGRGRWLLVAIYVVCVAIRLARFNVETDIAESAHRGFKGLPSPAAAMLIATLVASHERLIWYVAGDVPWAAGAAHAVVKGLPIVALVLGLLMVSRLNYTHVMTVYLRGRRPISHVLLGIVVIISAAVYPEFAGVILTTTYVLTGPIRWVVRRLHSDEDASLHEKAAAHEAGESDADEADSDKNIA